jgi:Icc-related predicted phosphoesterase
MTGVWEGQSYEQLFTYGYIARRHPRRIGHRLYPFHVVEAKEKVRMLVPVFFALLAFFFPAASASQPVHDSQRVLKNIYFEVKEFGLYPGEDFIKQEFFIGNDDDDDTNKDIHVVVMIQSTDRADKMHIQVTYLERTRDNPKVKYAKETKILACGVAGETIQVQRSDYEESELEGLTKDILKAIKNKKRLLKIIS